MRLQAVSAAPFINSASEAADFQHAGFFVLRAPLLSYSEFEKWNQVCLDAGPCALERGLDWLRERFREPLAREALGIASATLAERFDAWVVKPTTRDGDRIVFPLSRYLTRMATRSTPFGLFAGCALGTIANSNRLTVDTPYRNFRCTRLDTGLLVQVARSLAKDADLRQALRFRPNSSMTSDARRIQYAAEELAGSQRRYVLVELERTGALTAALNAAATAADFRTIALAVREAEPDVDMEEADEYVSELVDAQALVSDLGPAITSGSPLEAIVQSLSLTSSGHPAVQILKSVRDGIAALDATPIGTNRTAQEQEILRAIAPFATPASSSAAFQVDMGLATLTASISPNVAEQMLRTACLINDYIPWLPNEALARFRDDFVRRYGHASVPLLEALDEEAGIGFGRTHSFGQDTSTLLNGIHLGRSLERPAARAPTEFDKLIATKLSALPEHADELTLTEAELRALPRLNQPLPASFSLVGAIAARGADALERNQYELVLSFVDGPSAGNWLARFCNVLPSLTSHLQEIFRLEESLSPEAIHAEIVHLPSGPIGNILARPTLRAHEIVYLGVPSSDPADRIEASDLMVTVWQGRVALFSRSRRCEVIPRLASAHNFSDERNLPVYRFLGSLQAQSTPLRRTWVWPDRARLPTYLPRVKIGHTIVSLAQWRIERRLIDSLRSDFERNPTDAGRSFQDRFRLPRLVCVADGDNSLLLDLHNELSVASLVNLIQGRDYTILTEHFPSASDLCMSDRQGEPYGHELVIPFVRTKPSEADTVSALREPVGAPPIERTLVPGSDWLYLKLYASPRNADEALRSFAPLIDQLLCEGLVSSWFFVRESAPDWHLRLRFSGAPGALQTEVLPRVLELSKTLRKRSTIWRVELDTYEREIERYGGSIAMPLAEQLFFADSHDVLRMLLELPRSREADARWRLALIGLDSMLELLGLSLEAKADLAGRVCSYMAREVALRISTQREIDNRFRQERGRLEKVFFSSTGPRWSEPGFRFEGMKNLGSSVAARLRSLEVGGGLNASVAQLAPHFCHMHVNRMLRSALREQELILWDFLTRLYGTARARSRGRA